MNKKKLTLAIAFGVIGILLFALGEAGIFSNNAMRYLMQIFIYITLGEMWNLLSGFAGMTSLGQQTFIGIAGYSVAMATTVYKMNYGAGILIGVGICIITSSFLAFLLLKMEGMYFSITTWVIAEALGTFFLSWGYVGKDLQLVVYTQETSASEALTLECSFNPDNDVKVLDGKKGIMNRMMKITPEAKLVFAKNVDPYMMLPDEFLALAQASSFILAKPQESEAILRAIDVKAMENRFNELNIPAGFTAKCKAQCEL